jgi:hypothetical protein
VIVAAAEQPRLAAERYGFQGTFGAIVGQHQPAVVEEACEHFALIVCVLQGRARVSTLVAIQRALLADPREEIIDVWSQVLKTQAFDLGRRLALPRLAQLKDASNSEACFFKLALGSDPNTCAIRADKTVWCWGKGSTTPAKTADLSEAIGFASGYEHRCAVLAGGNVACWGYGGNGQLGNSYPFTTIPVDVIWP